MVYIQRSRGYSLRPSLLIEDIEKIAAIAKKKAPDCIVMVDNCYGEFVQTEEPTSCGADLMAGSLIKKSGWRNCAYRRIYCRKKRFGRKLCISFDNSGNRAER